MIYISKMAHSLKFFAFMKALILLSNF